MASAKQLQAASLILLFFIPVWLIYIAPELNKLSGNFEYKAVVFSLDNFYDAEKKEFRGEAVSNTEHYVKATGKENGALLIEDVFAANTFSGEKIISVKRAYGIDAKTRKHLPGYGDKNREGYLFAPLYLHKGQNFTYWHVNYDAPAPMKYKNEESIDGLTVYRYEADYHADQTFDLANIVPPSGDRGINLDINLQLWVEPVTGWKIKYEDRTTAYFYNLTTGERIHPWNQFHNKYDEISVLKQVEIAKHQKLKRYMLDYIIPILMVFTVIGLLYPYLRRKVQ